MFQYLFTDDGAVPPNYLMASDDIRPAWGMTMALSGGLLVQASGATVPTYVSMLNADADVTEGDLIPVTRVRPEFIYLSQLSEDGSGLSVGDKVKIASDGLRVTANKSGGVAEIVKLTGTAAGSNVYVRFPGTAEALSKLLSSLVFTEDDEPQALTPTFASATTSYTYATDSATTDVTATAEDPDATVAITVTANAEGETATISDGTVTWGAGSNTLTATVTNGGSTKTYTVTVTCSAE